MVDEDLSLFIMSLRGPLPRDLDDRPECIERDSSLPLDLVVGVGVRGAPGFKEARLVDMVLRKEDRAHKGLNPFDCVGFSVDIMTSDMNTMDFRYLC